MLENLNPRKFVAARIGWAALIIISLLALLCAWLVAKQTEHIYRQAATQSLQQYPLQIQREISANLNSRISLIRLTASQLGKQNQSSEELRIALESVRNQNPEISWIGLADNKGTVIAAADNLLIGENVSGLSWFQSGAKNVYLGGVRSAPLLKQLLPEAKGENQIRVVDLAAPVVDENGVTNAVLGAQISWAWIQNLQILSLRSIGSNTSHLQLITSSGDNTILSGPADLIARSIADISVLSEQGKYLVGTQESAHDDSARSDWVVSVRSESARALSAGRATQRRVFLIVGVAASLAALFILYAVSRLTRELRSLSEGAKMIASGSEYDPKLFKATEDVSQIGQVLSDSIENLQKEKNRLVTLNSELDQRVEDRTNDIKRLSAESREIALTQQRLRFARDMHDTLAHSMMAVLTQIRLVRKIRSKLSENEVEEELRRAEAVAATGLTEARAAILQIRADNVEGKGISAALHELVERFRARSGLQFSLRIDPQSIHQEDKRGETVYRMVEEALRNIEKHAKASEVKITLDSIEQRGTGEHTVPAFKLEIVDDGIGFNTQGVAPGHYGLIGLREQAALIDGEMTVTSEPGSGTKIQMTYQAYSS